MNDKGAAKEAVWEGETERVDKALTKMQISRSRIIASQMIAEGSVFVDGAKVTKPSQKIKHGQLLTAKNTVRDVGRGAQKLREALKIFQINPDGATALDVGASTGGFTQVLLDHGAQKVVAIDVGHGQLVEELRKDSRVINVEGFNARYLDQETLSLAIRGAPPQTDSVTQTNVDLIVADVSFISITELLQGFKKVAGETTKIVVLVKPQFEVGVENIGRGVVTDTALQEKAITKVVEKALELGMNVDNIINSPVLGSLGNREFLMLLSLPSTACGEGQGSENLGQKSEQWKELVKGAVFAQT